MHRLVPLLLILLLPGHQALAQAGSFLGGLPPARLCRPAIDLAERRHAIPARLLHAIGRVESGRADPGTGQVNPWPWTANAEGQGFYFDTKPQAVAAIAAIRARGVRSIDVGCMQVNLMHHPDAFASLDQAFDPVANTDYAARFLRRLFEQTGTWQKAAARYHSATPELGEAYQKRVLAIWPEEQKQQAATGTGALAAAWGATLPGGFAGRSLGGRIIPNANGANPLAAGAPAAARPGAPVGRTLEAYRAAPITWAFRPPPASASPKAGPPKPSPPKVTGSAAPIRPGVHFLR